MPTLSATIHFVSDRQTDTRTDRRHYDDNSWSHRSLTRRDSTIG